MTLMILVGYGAPGEVPQAPPKGAGLQDLMNLGDLEEGLSKAICTEAGPPVIPEGATQARDRFFARPNLSELELIAFLLGEKRMLVGRRAQSFASTKAFERQERKLALDLCEQAQSMERALDVRPQDFLELSLSAGTGGAPTLMLSDPSQRFGSLRGRWWVAGWVRRDEVVSAQVSRRHYSLERDVVTQEVSQVWVGAPDIPLAQVRLFKKGMDRGQKLSPIPLYQSWVHAEALEALRDNKDRWSEIRDLEKYYTSLLEAYSKLRGSAKGRKRFEGFTPQAPAQGSGGDLRGVSFQSWPIAGQWV